MATHSPKHRTNTIHLQQKTIRSHHPQPTQTSHQHRIQRLTPRPPTLHKRTLPPILGKHTEWPKLRQLHRQPRRNKRPPMGRPSPTTQRNTHHQRATLLHMHQTHLHQRNHPTHTPPRPNIPTMATMPTNPTNQRNHHHHHPPPHNHPNHHHLQPQPQKPTLTQKKQKIEYIILEGKA